MRSEVDRKPLASKDDFVFYALIYELDHYEIQLSLSYHSIDILVGSIHHEKEGINCCPFFPQTPKPDKNGNKPFLSEDLDGHMQMQEAVCARLDMVQQ